MVSTLINNEFAKQFLQSVQEIIDESDSKDKKTKPELATALAVLDVFGKSKEWIKTDGAGDRGIDWYTQGENECEIWQFKCRSELDLERFNQQGVPGDIADISRILDYIENVFERTAVSNKQVIKFQTRLESALKKKAKSDEPEYYFKINMFVACKDFSKQTKDEIEAIKNRAAKINEISTSEGPVLIDVQIDALVFPDVVNSLKNAENPDWYDLVENKKKDTISLRFEGKIIDDSRCQIFFAKASDLVDAYTRFGYRIFEPNVRCYLQSSRVNEAIRNSLQSSKGIENFKYLNNGVTIFYESINKKKQDTGKLIFKKPGVVNGLQTIKTLSEVYRNLDTVKKNEFDDKCYVQVRAFRSDAGIPVDDIIIATNNQNKMNQRNLESNSETQKFYEQAFANKGWFYERKDGSWQAFCESSGDWPGLIGKRSTHFGNTQKKDRRVLSNEDVAVAWLSFSGYSDIARSEKTKIFESDQLRQRCFELVPAHHGYDYSFERRGPIKDPASIEEAPDPGTLLLASICHLTLRNILPTKKETDKNFITKYKLDGLTVENQQAELLNKPDYIAQLMMVSAPFTFVELMGFLFLKTVNGQHERLSEAVLSSPGLVDVYKNKDFSVIQKMINEENVDEGDFFASVYFLWKNIWEELASSGIWRNNLLAASSRPSHAHLRENRMKIIDRIIELDNRISKTPLNNNWSRMFDKHKSIIKVIRRGLL